MFHPLWRWVKFFRKFEFQQRAYITSVCVTGVIHVLLQVQVTPDIDLDSISFVCFRYSNNEIQVFLRSYNKILIKHIPGISAWSLCARSLTFARTSSRTPYIEPVVSNDIATSSRPPGGSNAVVAASSPSLVPIDDRILDVFDNVFFSESAFFRDSFVARVVSPILEPDFKGTTVVTVPPSTTTLDTFFVRDTFGDEFFFDEILFVNDSIDFASFSSTVNVDAFLNNGGVGDSRSLPPVEGEDPDIASSFVELFLPTDGILDRELGLRASFSPEEVLASLLGLSSGEEKDDDFRFPSIVSFS